MDANGLTNIASIAPPNLPVGSEPPPSGSLPADLTEAHQAATSQSLYSGASDIWSRIRGDFSPPGYLMDNWKSNASVDAVGDTSFGKEVKRYQDILAETGREQNRLTTALAAHINDLGVDSCLYALKVLFGLNCSEGVTFNRYALEELTGSRWLECFPDNERDQVFALIKTLPRTR